MSIASLIVLTIKTSIVLSVFAIGLRATHRDATYFFRNPAKLASALLSMSVVMPLFAVLLAGVFNLHPAVKIALVALSVSPIPPLLPRKQMKAGGKESYAIGLLVAIGLLAIVFVPLALELVERLFAIPLSVSPGEVLLLVLMTVLAPLGTGIAVHTVAPSFADKIARPVGLVSLVMLSVSVLPILFTSFPAVTSLIGNGSILAFVAFVVVGLAVGHLLGGPDAEDRPVLALSTASRHPGVAVAIAHANFPEQKLAMAAVLLYLLVSMIVSIPYLKWATGKVAAPSDTADVPQAHA
ncbi:MAG TPA: Na+-dependent transporter [Blastocatellia bacterium]|nr:Na+-dependent transporter [Blastocatellia bacterium]